MPFHNFWFVLLLLSLETYADVLDSAKKKSDFQRFAALPIVAYSEETKWQYGAMILLFTRPDSLQTESSALDFAAYGTQNNQFQMQISPDLYLFQNRIHMDMDFVYWNWVAHFYGIGNSPDRNRYTTYDMTRYSIQVPIETNWGLPPLLSFLRYGLWAHWERNRVTFREGDINPPELQGKDRFGLGYRLSLDTRNHPNWPMHGFYLLWKQMFYNDVIGDYDFLSQTLDCRAYTYLFWRTSIALGALWDMRQGDVPFDALATLDGVKRFRGVERGLFYDKQMFSLQTELRRPLFWRFGGTIFYEAGKVGPYFGKLMRNEWHHAVGFGGRLALNRSETLNARGDLSLIDGQYIGMTIYIREAF